MRDLTLQQQRVLELLRKGRFAEVRSIPGWGNTVRSLRALGLMDDNTDPRVKR